MIVLDASVALSGLLNEGPSRDMLARETLHVPYLIDSEVVSGLRRMVAARLISADAGWAALDVWRELGMNRHSLVGLLERMWHVHDNLSAYDAGYVALAESLGCGLVTADRRISGAPGIRCPVTVLPR